MVRGCAIGLALLACRPGNSDSAATERSEHATLAQPTQPTPARADDAAIDARPDWRNFTYDTAIGLVLADGVAELRQYREPRLDAMHDTTRWTLTTVEYGDLDGDSDDDAAVLIDEVVASSDPALGHRLGRVYVFLLDGRTARAVGSVTTYGPSARVAIDRGALDVSWPTANGRCEQTWLVEDGALTTSQRQTCKE